MRVGQRRMHVWAGFVAAAVLIGAVTACDGDNVAGPQAIDYTLQSIDGNPLPYQISQSSDGSVTTVVNDMVLSVFEDRTWRAVGHETITTNGVASTQLVRDGGMYTPADSTTFRNSAGDIVWVGTVDELAVSVTDSARRVYSFKR